MQKLHLLKSCLSFITAAALLSACNDAKKDNNSPNGNSYNRMINDGPGAHRDTDPQNSGGIQHDDAAFEKQKNPANERTGDGSTGTILPADTTRGSNNAPGRMAPADKTSNRESTDKKIK